MTWVRGRQPDCPGCGRPPEEVEGYPMRWWKVDWCIHPSVHVKEQLEAFVGPLNDRKIDAFARQLGLIDIVDEPGKKLHWAKCKVAPGWFKAFMQGDNPLDAELAWRLHRVLGPSPDYWMNCQKLHDLVKDKPKGLSKLKRLKKPRGSGK